MAAFEGKKDFTAEVKVALPQSETIAASQGLEEAIAFLLPLEKKCRVNNDFTNLKEVSVQLVRLSKGKNDWDKLNAMLTLINKRSAQHKVALTAVVQEAMSYLESTPTMAVKVSLMKTLKDVCAGKIYVEGESAKLHFMLAKIYEDQGDIALACDTIQDVHVETYGSLSKNEKALFILEQIRLNLIRKDFIRTAIQSRKMNLKTLEENGFEEIKVKYYVMQIEYHMYQKDAWEISQAAYKIASTKLSNSPLASLRQEALETCVVFLLLARHDNQQHDMLHRLTRALDTDFKDLPLSSAFSQSLRLFTRAEIIDVPYAGQKDIENHASVHKLEGLGAHWVKVLGERIVQHNLRIIAQYYKRIELTRLCELLQLSRAEAEQHLSEMSFQGDLQLKIDRPAGIVSFTGRKNTDELLSDWAGDVGALLGLLETTCHMVNREMMVHKV